MDLATLAGLGLAFGCVFGGFLMEGGHIQSILQPTAGMIVVGGTIGAVCVQFPGNMLLAGIKNLGTVFKPPHENLVEIVQMMVNFATKARKEGVVSLEAEVDKITDHFTKKALSLAVDGTDANAITDAMDVELHHLEEQGLAGSKMFEAAGGYVPTVGILGAVLGLIHVMQNLSDPAKLGGGIAVAFVATVYGVALANIIFLPMSAKMKMRHEHKMRKYEMVMIGVVGIVGGENPRVIEQKLIGFLEAKDAAAFDGGKKD